MKYIVLNLCIIYLYSNENKLIFSDSGYSLKINDINKEIEILRFDALNRRFLTIECFDNNLLLLGSDNSYVDMYDMRMKNKLRNLYKHDNSNEVCKIKYSKNNHYIFSGGNDNKVIIYDLRKEKICNVLKHKAAIKGLSFSTNEDILVTGGGTFDKTLKIWDLKKMSMITESQTDSQITNIDFISNDTFLVSNGYISNNIIMYKLRNNSLKKEVILEKHNKRILFMSRSESNNIVSSLSTDGVVKLWKINKFMIKNTLGNSEYYCAIR